MSEYYSGIKFQPVFINKNPPNHPDIADLIQWCSLFHEKGLAPAYPGGSYGNLSFRNSIDSFIITGTCIGLKDQLNNSCFVEVHECRVSEKQIFITGTRAPSSETLMHYALYKSNPAINAIFHGHNDLITKNAARLGIPETETEIAYGTQELAEAVVKISINHNFLVIKNHGFVAMGQDMISTGNLCLEWLSKTSRFNLL